MTKRVWKALQKRVSRQLGRTLILQFLNLSMAMEEQSFFQIRLSVHLQEKRSNHLELNTFNTMRFLTARFVKHKLHLLA